MENLEVLGTRRHENSVVIAHSAALGDRVVAREYEYSISCALSVRASLPVLTLPDISQQNGIWMGDDTENAWRLAGSGGMFWPSPFERRFGRSCAEF